MAKTKARIWGYARSSRDEQIEGPQTQAERIEARAKELEAEGEGIFAEVLLEHESADKVPYHQRVQYVRLLERMEGGDILIVCWLNRIERNALRMISACELLARRGIRLIELDSMFGNTELDLGTAMGRTMLLMHSMFVNYDADQRSKATKAGQARARRLGRIVGRYAPYGHRIVPKKVTEYVWTKGKRVPQTITRKYLVWDSGECQQIAELVVRHRSGESMASIARDWHARQLKRAGGELWSPKYATGQKGQVAGQRLYRVYQWGEEQIAAHGNIGGIEVAPKKEPAMPAT